MELETESVREDREREGELNTHTGGGEVDTERRCKMGQKELETESGGYRGEGDWKRVGVREGKETGRQREGVGGQREERDWKREGVRAKVRGREGEWKREKGVGGEGLEERERGVRGGRKTGREKRGVG